MSIDSRELRLGNLVAATHNGGWNNVCTIRNNRVNGSLLKYFNPIPLTTDVLIKSGFQADTKMSHWHYYRIRIGEYGKHKTLTLAYAPNSDCFYFEAKKGRRMETVITELHHLQNLYFSLTGKELDVKP